MQGIRVTFCVTEKHIFISQNMKKILKSLIFILIYVSVHNLFIMDEGYVHNKWEIHVLQILFCINMREKIF